MNINSNQSTQPLIPMPVFQNWQVVAQTWYFVCPAKDISHLEAKSFSICEQHIVIFRGQDGQLRAMDGYCPHMGTDLGIGKVTGNRLRCFFHHWEFDGSGDCQVIPCGAEIPPTASIQTYAVKEKFGLIWVFPAAEATFDLPNFPDPIPEDAMIVLGKSYQRSCHHHVTMINGIDPQHLKTVHNLSIQMDININEVSSGLTDFDLVGDLPRASLGQKLVCRLIGKRYGYGMRYCGGSIGYLTLAKYARILRWPFPRLTMIFAYRPLKRGETLVQPIFISKKPKGLLGNLKAYICICLTKVAFYSLQGEDGKVYENMRFNPNALIAMDRPVAVFIKSINRLKPSIWSRR